MDCYFINNLNLPYTNRVRKGDLYDKFIDEYFVPADFVCIAGGISEFDEIESSFLIRLAQRYRGVFYVYGGSDMNSDIPLANKFENVKNRLRCPQKTKCNPVRLDGTCTERFGVNIGGAMGFSMQEKISSWKWWTDDKISIFSDEVSRVENVINTTPTPNIVITYYHPDEMNIDYSDINIWHYGNSAEKSIIEKDGKILLTNDCHANFAKFNKEDFLLKV
jgi:hypothetical protein